MTYSPSIKNCNNPLNSVTSYTLENVIDYYPYGKVLRHYAANDQEKFLSTGNQRDEETSTNDFGNGLDYRNARYGDAETGGRFLSTDPLTEQAPDWTPYRYAFCNPVNFIDPTGLLEDEYTIQADGKIEVNTTEDSFDQFYLASANGNKVLIAQFEKNARGLIQLPSSFDFSNADFGTEFGFNLKSGNAYRGFIRGDAFASLFGALATTNTKDLTITGFSLSNGNSPKPSVSHIASVSHIDGKNGDLRYFRTDGSGDKVLLGKEGLDLARQNTFNAALKKFGWTDMLSEYFIPYGQTETTILDNN